MTEPEPVPDFDAPDIVAQLDAWRRTDAAIGGFATVVSQRARIVELESEVDRLTERAVWWELETRRLQSELEGRDAGPAAPTATTGPVHRRLPRLR